MESILNKIILPEELKTVLAGDIKITVPEDRNDLLDLALGGKDNSYFEVAYDVPGKGRVVEATVVRCKNGVVINYTDIYLRRRDPDCMVIADNGKSDKQRYEARYGCNFTALRKMTFDWLSRQNLILMPFMAGGEELGYPVLLVAPDNAGFFAGGLADLQGFIPGSALKEGFKPKAIIYLAPPFRHTHFNGKQMVVHNRLNDIYELFSYNLYPGPSAKKGVYGILLKIGEDEGWVTAHGSTVMVITPYENIITIMHEGASGGGKSEMTEQLHRELDGRIIVAKNLVTAGTVYLDLKETCEIRPVTDDMALCHPKLQNESKKLVVKDAENGWFLRTDHIKKYGTDPYLEERCIHPPEPLIFLNYDAAPGSTCLLWEHVMDAPGKLCPNPRVIMPRRFVPNIVDEPVEIDVRSFGVRTPPCTKGNPTYGIIGLFHILPPALAWLWRLVSPRGHDNPSITKTEGMTSEGVGSYWPFATGKMVEQANLLLEQIMKTSNTRYVLIPNQHIGAYQVGFMPQWIAREYLARRGSARFKPQQLVPSRCPLLGYALGSIKVDGTFLPKELLEVNLQPEVENDGFDIGAQILMDFFVKELEKFNTSELDPLGKQIIECCLDNGPIEEYLKFIPMKI
ncbi:MAG: DUF4914 family protein [Firmicutes bacterium]|nr:DUF4914 family protein [Bacillota bacterium]